MNPEDFLSDNFLKQFKTGQQLNDFLGQPIFISLKGYCQNSITSLVNAKEIFRSYYKLTKATIEFRKIRQTIGTTKDMASGYGRKHTGQSPLLWHDYAF